MSNDNDKDTATFCKLMQEFLTDLFKDTDTNEMSEAKDNSFKKHILGVEISTSLKLKCDRKPLTISELDYVSRLEKRIDEILAESSEIISEAINRAYNEV
jgi:hypothetical protein